MMAVEIEGVALHLAHPDDLAVSAIAEAIECA